MSKAKPKDKKNDASSQLQKQVEMQKRSIIDYQFTVKKLEQRILEKVADNENLSKQLEQTRQIYQEKVHVMNGKIQQAQKSHDEQMDKITDLQLAGNRAEARIKSLKEELNMEKQNRLREVTELKQKIQTQRLKKDLKLKSLQEQMDQRQANEIQIQELRQKLREERDQKVSDLADKQREKVQATDKLRDDMLKQIREMHTKYVSLKKQQLDTTTRLTILQNHQLTSQLEYQSKQTQKLIFQEQDTRQQVKQLNQELAIHKQVQEELAKRAHFSKGIIKRLNEKITELEEELTKVKNSKNCDNTILSQKMMNTSSQHIHSKNNFENTQKNEIYSELQKQLGMTQKKYTQLHAKLDAITKQRDNANKRIRKYENCTNQLAKALINYSEEIINSNEIDLEPREQQNNVVLDPIVKLEIDALRLKEVDNWSNEELGTVIKILLNLIKPYLTKKNLQVPAIKKLLIIQENQNENTQKKLPKLLGEQSSKGLRDLPINISSKIVASNLREWGNTVRYHDGVKKKYKISQSNR